MIVYNLENSIGMTINYMDASTFENTLNDIQETPEDWPNLTQGMEIFLKTFPYEKKIKEM